jgi:2-methylisocitrate lyase-like PEP mutase family enzyme
VVSSTSVPLLFNWAEGGKTPPLTYDTIAELGFAMILTPITTLLSAVEAMRSALATLHTTRTPAPFVDELMPFATFTDLIGLPEVELLQRGEAPDAD